MHTKRIHCIPLQATAPPSWSTKQSVCIVHEWCWIKDFQDLTTFIHENISKDNIQYIPYARLTATGVIMTAQVPAKLRRRYGLYPLHYHHIDTRQNKNLRAYLTLKKYPHRHPGAAFPSPNTRISAKYVNKDVQKRPMKETMQSSVFCTMHSRYLAVTFLQITHEIHP